MSKTLGWGVFWSPGESDFYMHMAAELLGPYSAPTTSATADRIAEGVERLAEALRVRADLLDKKFKEQHLPPAK